MLNAERIKEARERLKESQSEFAHRFGVVQPTISRWETVGPPKRGPARMTVERILSELEDA